MKYWAFLLSAFLLLSCNKKDPIAPPPTADTQTLRTVAEGSIIGFSTDNGANVWRAIPYADDTSGDNRWRAPRPAPKRNETLNALEFGPVCPQIATPFTPVPGFTNGELEGSENCLTFDIYAPSNAVGKDLPVMMWIHGGGNVFGTSQLYQAHNLVVNENVIVLAVQYRLGPLGWFSHPALRSSAVSEADTAANFALLDQISALNWIQDNVATFGGDPNNVTIFGESAGGHNVAALLASPLARGLFHKAIIQSGFFDSVSREDAENGELLNPANSVASKLGIDKFHTATTQEIFDAYDLTPDGYMELPRVIEDGVTIASEPLLDRFKDRKNYANVPIITGTNRDEMKMFFLTNPDLTKKRGPLYTAKNQDLYDAASDYSARNWRLAAVDYPIALMNESGHEPVYAYRFDWDEGGKFLTMDLSKMLGAAHALEIPFVFNRFIFLGDADRIMYQAKTEDSRQELSRAMGAYWANFARNGRPSAASETQWRPYHSDGAVLHFDARNDRGIRIEIGGDTGAAIITDMARDTRIDDPERCRILDGLSQLTDAEKARAEQRFNCSGN